MLFLERLPFLQSLALMFLFCQLWKEETPTLRRAWMSRYYEYLLFGHLQSRSLLTLQKWQCGSWCSSSRDSASCTEILQGNDVSFACDQWEEAARSKPRPVPPPWLTVWLPVLCTFCPLQQPFHGRFYTRMISRKLFLFYQEDIKNSMYVFILNVAESSNSYRMSDVPGDYVATSAQLRPVFLLCFLNNELGGLCKQKQTSNCRANVSNFLLILL